jgi:hypothetical protein
MCGWNVTNFSCTQGFDQVELSGAEEGGEGGMVWSNNE